MTRVAIAYPTAERLRTLLKYDHGTPASRIERAYVIEPSGCWRWIKGLTTNGYGHMSIHHVYYQAHRLLYILRFGFDIPDGLFPDHLCRHRWCVNPDHLEPVTGAVNVQRGSGARLTPEQVDAIRVSHRAGISLRTLGKHYGVDHATIHRVCSGKSWADRPFPAEAVAA